MLKLHTPFYAPLIHKHFPTFICNCIRPSLTIPLRRSSKWINHLLLLPLFFITSGFSATDSYIGIERFTIEPSVSKYYNSLDILLFQRLSFELLPQGVKPLLVTDTVFKSCIATITGKITSDQEDPVLTITIASLLESGEEIKKIPLKDQSTDAIVDIMAIKVRHFLEQNISGKLRISSTPLDCDVLLNGIKIGKTPAELVLQQGTYSIELQKEYLFPHRDSILVSAGKETSLSATLEFQGHKVKPWVTSGIVFTSCVLASWLIESKLHSDYLNLKTADGEIFTQKWNQYRIANAVRIIFLIPMATSWSITGYQIMENRSLKKQIFGK